MGILEDVMKALERVPGWKRISAAPSEIDELKRRVAALELQLKPGGEVCPICKSAALSVISSAPHPVFGTMGVKEDTMKCASCGHQETRERKPR